MTKSITFLTVLAISAGLVAAAPPQSAGPSPAEQKEGFKPLFDGKTLTGWTSRAGVPGPARGNAPAPAARPAAKWAVENGEIVAMKGSGGGHLVTSQPYGDFTLRLEFWADPEANSGIFLRSPETGAINANDAYEVNIFDPHEQWPTGSVNNVQKTSAKGTPSTAGKWNTYEMTAQGDHVIIVLNGQKTVDASAKRLPRGLIALQAPAMGTVKFRNIRIKTL
jgi:Domain of Unknown Function (DUF1080)